MKRKFLEDLGLAKEIVDQIMAENGKDIESAKGDLDTEKNKSSELEKEIEGYRSQIKDRDKQLEGLKKSTGNNEELQKKIEQLESDNKKASEDHSAEIVQLKIDSAVTSALTTAKAKNTVAVKALLNLNDVKLAEDGSVIGLKEQIENLTKGEDTKFLFETTTFKGAKPGESGIDPSDEPVDFSKMTYDEIEAYTAEHPEN